MTSKLNMVYSAYKKKQEASEQLLREFFKDDTTINAEKESFSNLWDEFKASDVKTKSIEVQEQMLKIDLALQQAFIVRAIYKKELKNKIDESSFLNQIFYRNTLSLERDLYPYTKVDLVNRIQRTAVSKDMKHITITIEPPKSSWIDILLNFFDKILCCSSQIDDELKYTVSVEKDNDGKLCIEYPE
jgi:hypothetical protein